jgi:hypothetical protein
MAQPHAGHSTNAFIQRGVRRGRWTCRVGDLVEAMQKGTNAHARRLAVAVGCRPLDVVHITDQEPMLELMQHNITLNKLEDRVIASVYSWGDSDQPPVPQPDVLLAADCVYFEPAFPLLQQSLKALIGPQTTCYFCFKKRRRADLRFMNAVHKQFAVESVVDDPDRENYARENIFLYVENRELIHGRTPIVVLTAEQLQDQTAERWLKHPRAANLDERGIRCWSMVSIISGLQIAQPWSHRTVRWNFVRIGDPWKQRERASL